MNNRNHRKVVIVDGRIAFTGGINISDVYSSGSSPGAASASRARRSARPRFGSRIGSAPRGRAQVGWRDTNVRIEGPAVAQLQRLFLETWAKQDGEPLPRARLVSEASARGRPSRCASSRAGRAIAVPAIYVSLALGDHARREIGAHHDGVLRARSADDRSAQGARPARGVDVTLVLPSYTDFWAVFHAGRSHYSDLLDAGREDLRAPGGAAAREDRSSSTASGRRVGSSNIDWRSFLHNEELNAVILGWDFGKQMEAMFERDLRESVRIDREAWERRPLDVRMKEWAARMWEYWL